jgi:glutathionylspermidine synthase
MLYFLFKKQVKQGYQHTGISYSDGKIITVHFFVSFSFRQSYDMSKSWLVDNLL